MHIVTYNTEMYKDFAAAAGSPKGLAVISVLFKLDNNERDDQERTGLDTFGDFMSKLSAVIGSGTTTEVSVFNPSVLLPSDTQNFYRYYGSLTTPPCTENVQWTVMRDTLPVTSEQVSDVSSVLF